MKATIISKKHRKTCIEPSASTLKADLIASEVRYRRLFESAKDGILILDGETGRIIDVNPFLVSLLGFSKDEFIGKEIWEIGFFRDVAANKEKFSELQKREYVRYENLPLETAGGRKINVEFVSNVYLENDHRIIQCNVRDITERRRKEDALINAEIRRRNLLQTIPDLIWLKDTEGCYISCNTMFERFFGAKEDKIIGKTDYDFVDRELADSFTENDRIAMHADKPTINEEWITFADDGHLAYLETIKSPMYDADKNLIGILGIGRDITQRKRFETELIQAKEDAEESDRLKSAFLTNMSHEIRTPMNGILGFAELLKEPMLTIEEKNEYIDIIEKSGIRLLNLINDILSISKIESGQSEIINSKININELIKEICAFFRPEAAQKGIILRFIKHLPYNEAVIKTDSNKVSAILTNLIKNAIKFTNTGSIEIGYTNKDSLLEFFVKDTGIGVRPEQKEMIFERFRQGSESLIRNYEGAGLGLSISKGYAEMLGGKIWVETNQDTPISDELTENRGSIFFFTIPYFPVIEENIPVKEIFPYIAIEKQYENLKILIVEDDKVSELLISINAGKIAKDLKRVNTGPEAVEFCHIHPDIDLIIMDIKLPGMDGFEATRQIRKFNKDVIIIAQTAFGLSGAREKAIDAGCNEFIEKPVKFAQLNNLIKKLFNK